jgi:hypothetical protein
VRDGGARPDIAPEAPTLIAFGYDFPAHSIVIDTGGRKLYYVLADKRAYAYAISVGREGFNWAGTETISRKQAWPDWHPPAEMRERDPKLPEKMTGGLNNPLGAMALYLGSTLYRIHGTNDANPILAVDGRQEHWHRAYLPAVPLLKVPLKLRKAGLSVDRVENEGLDGAHLMQRTSAGSLHYSEPFTNGLALFAECEERGLEGVIAKHINSIYRSGPSSAWIKVKCPTWREANKNRADVFNRHRS